MDIPQNNHKKITYWLKVAVIGIALGFGLQFVRAWTEPSVAPPNGNVGAPINTSNIDQTKGSVTSGKINAKDFCLNSDSTKCLSTLLAPAPSPKQYRCPDLGDTGNGYGRCWNSNTCWGQVQTSPVCDFWEDVGYPAPVSADYGPCIGRGERVCTPI